MLISRLPSSLSDLELCGSLTLPSSVTLSFSFPCPSLSSSLPPSLSFPPSSLLSPFFSSSLPPFLPYFSLVLSLPSYPTSPPAFNQHYRDGPRSISPSLETSCLSLRLPRYAINVGAAQLVLMEHITTIYLLGFMHTSTCNQPSLFTCEDVIDCHSSLG